MTIDERISSELRRQAPQVDEQAAWERFQSRAPVRHHVWARRLLPVATAVGVILLGITLVQILPSGPGPASPLQSPFRGTWFTTDNDGSAVTMTVDVSSDGIIEVTAVDDYASVCSGAPSTMTGSGRLEGETALVIPAPILTCDDGTEPQALNGESLEDILRDLTFTHVPEDATITDSLGSSWTREAVDEPDPDPTPPEFMWPQSSQAEVEEAQELADSGDPDHSWQVAPEIVGDTAPGDAGIFTRFLTQELGWESFRWSDATTLYWGGDCATAMGCTSYEVGFVRCATGQTNPLYPEDDFGGRCAPTIDEVTYETVTISVEQLADRGPSGIWVVTDSSTSQGLQQRVPRSDAEVADVLDRFLQARVDGQGAEELVDPSSDAVSLPYAASNGSSYERFDYTATPRWPTGEFDVTIRLYADGGNTVVEQQFTLDEAWDRLTYHHRSTMENGQASPEPYEILDGQVRFGVPAPWYGFFDYGQDTIALVYPELPEALPVLGVLPDPLPLATGCEPGPASIDAEALAQSVLSDPDLEATEPVAARVGGIEALQMDVVATAGAGVCESGSPEVLVVDNAGAGFRGPGLEPGSRMRLYLLNLPEGSSARTLAITFVAPEAHLETVLEYAAPILDTFEFQAG